MKDTIEAIGITMLVVVGMIFLVGSCSEVVRDNNKAYYELARRCVDAGGSWVPGRTNDMCIAKGSTQ